jgi:hypothetical protein
VLVGVDDDAEIHPVDGGVAIPDMDFAGEVIGGLLQMRLLDGFKRALEPADYVGFGSDGLLGILFQVVGHFGAGDAEQVEVGHDDVHVDFAG